MKFWKVSFFPSKCSTNPKGGGRESQIYQRIQKEGAKNEARPSEHLSGLSSHYQVVRMSGSQVIIHATSMHQVIIHAT